MSHVYNYIWSMDLKKILWIFLPKCCSGGLIMLSNIDQDICLWKYNRI